MTMLQNNFTVTGRLACDPKDFSKGRTKIARLTIYVNDGDISYPLDFTAFNDTALHLLNQAKQGALITISYTQKNQRGTDGKWYNNLNITDYEWINPANRLKKTDTQMDLAQAIDKIEQQSAQLAQSKEKANDDLLDLI